MIGGIPCLWMRGGTSKGAVFLAAVGPAAIERGLVAARDGETPVRIHMLNTHEVALARVQTPGGRVTYAGDAAIDGVPGTAAAVP